MDCGKEGGLKTAKIAALMRTIPKYNRVQVEAEGKPALIKFRILIS